MEISIGCRLQNPHFYTFMWVKDDTFVKARVFVLYIYYNALLLQSSYVYLCPDRSVPAPSEVLVNNNTMTNKGNRGYVKQQTKEQNEKTCGE